MAGSLLSAAALLVLPCTASPDAVVVFNEVQYNPAGPAETGEWIELFNQMGIKVDISGWRIDGAGFTFPPNTIVDPGAHVVVAKTPGAGQFGPFTGTLDNGGETLRLFNKGGRLMDELAYDDSAPWPVGPDNSGATLAKRSPYSASGDGSLWSPSAQIGGTPGAVNFISPASSSGIRFSEIESATAGAFGLEITNTSDVTLDLTGMTVSVEGETARQYGIPSGTLAPGAFLWMNEATLGFRPARNEKLFLYSPGRAGVIDAREVTNRLRGLSALHGASWLYPDAVTPGAANVFSLNNSVVIQEIQYHPPPLPAVPAVPATYQNTTLIDHNSVWRYNAADENLPQGWAATVHPATGNWKSGTAPIGRETATLPVPLATSLSPYTGATLTYYFEREFNLTPAQLASIDSLQLTHQIDDGAVFYINGVETSYRFNMPAGVVGPETQANPSVSDAVLVTTTLPAANLVAGSNRISVEVHQYGTASSDMVFGLKLEARLLLTPAVAALPMRDSDNQWIELTNRGTSVVDLSGWKLTDAIDHTFAAGTTLAPGEQACVVRNLPLFQAAYPAARVLGVFSGSLARSGERIHLSDLRDNPVDEVRYHDGGQWPETPDGGGASLELRDPDADNSAGGAWAASDESSRTAWKTYTYSAVAAASKGPDAQWSEFNLGMLAEGEVWIDDVSVIENGSTQKLTDTGFNNPAAWRLRGNHRHSQIISEPGNASNKILRIVASGPTEHMHNQIETTLASAVSNGATYQISFRARWVNGMNQLHTRLYFNRCARMNVIDRVANPGTPSAPNTRAATNIGPTFAGLVHSPAVPASSQGTTVSVRASDPDGVSAATLFYSVNGAVFSSLPMTLNAGVHRAMIPGQPAGAVVQFYVRATDALGAQSFHPARGPDSRALYKVNDGTAASNGLHNFRLITTNADRDFMHEVTEVMSNDRIGCTVIDREGDIYYGAAVRLKSSQRGRDETNRVGYHIEFPPDGLYRGIHSSVAIDRSEGLAPGQRELLFDMMISNSGGPISRYNDLIRILAPNSALTGSAILQMARYDDVFLDSQFEDGAAGSIHEYELVYYPTTTDSAGRKLPSPDLVINVNRVSNQGDSIEDYRWNFLNKINREAENFGPIMRYCKLFSLSGAAFEAALPAAVDLDPWFRGMACGVLTGAGDNAAAGSFHNGVYYARPDGRIIFLPHDMDYSFSETRSIYANLECAALTASAVRNRIYLGHLHDIISTTYKNSYMSLWSNHFAALDPAQDWAAELAYLTNRSNNVLSQINAQIAPAAFSITTASPLRTSASSAVIQGTGWVNVRDIRIAGATTPLGVTWTGATAWQASIPAAPGSNTVAIEALDFSGNVIGTASIIVDSTTVIEPASSENLVVTEIMYHPADPTPAEITAGFIDADDFEFIELTNISAQTISLTGVVLSGAVDYAFTSGTTLAAGARTIIARNRNAFLLRHPASSGSLAAGAFLNASALNNAGESITLSSSFTGLIRSFSYDDASPWPAAADGDGYSLVLIAPATNPDHSLAANWRESAVAGGNPGASDSVPFSGVADADADRDGIPALVEHALGTSDLGRNGSGLSWVRDSTGALHVSCELSLAADDVVAEFQSSADLVSWTPDFEILTRQPTGEGSVSLTARAPASGSTSRFVRIAVRKR